MPSALKPEPLLLGATASNASVMAASRPDDYAAAATIALGIAAVDAITSDEPSSSDTDSSPSSADFSGSGGDFGGGGASGDW